MDRSPAGWAPIATAPLVRIAGAGTGTVDVADFAEFSQAHVEIGLIDAEGLDAFAVAPAEGVPGLYTAP